MPPWRLHLIAKDLQQRAEAIDLNRPMAIVLPSIEHWQSHHEEQPMLPAPNNSKTQDKPLLPLSKTNRRTKKRK